MAKTIYNRLVVSSTSESPENREKAYDKFCSIFINRNIPLVEKVFNPMLLHRDSEQMVLDFICYNKCPVREIKKVCKTLFNIEVELIYYDIFGSTYGIYKYKVSSKLKLWESKEIKFISEDDIQDISIDSETGDYSELGEDFSEQECNGILAINKFGAFLNEHGIDTCIEIHETN